MELNALSIEAIVKKIVSEMESPAPAADLSIPVGISNRHIHLSREDLDTLFGKGYELTPIKDLSQPGQYACKEQLTIIGPSMRPIEGVRVLSSGVRTSESTFPPSGREMAAVPSSPGMMSLIEGIPVSVAASELMVTKASSASAIESAVIILPLTVINLLVLSFICEILPLYIGVLFPTLFCHEKRILCAARNFI